MSKSKHHAAKCTKRAARENWTDANQGVRERNARIEKQRKYENLLMERRKAEYEEFLRKQKEAEAGARPQIMVPNSDVANA